MSKVTNPIWEAVETNNIAQLTELAELGWNFQTRDANHLTLLHFAQSADVVRLLVDAGANPKATGYYGKTPLHMGKNADVIKALVESGVDATAVEMSGHTALYFAKAACNPYRSVSQLEWKNMRESIKLLELAESVSKIEEQHNAGVEISAEILETTLVKALDLEVGRFCIQLIEAGSTLDSISHTGKNVFDILVKTDNTTGFEELLNFIGQEQLSIVLDLISGTASQKHVVSLLKQLAMEEATNNNNEASPDVLVTHASAEESKGDDGEDDMADLFVSEGTGMGSGTDTTVDLSGGLHTPDSDSGDLL